MQIEKLPDFPAMRQLADALWLRGPTRGAAVLVGAGFSRAAERPSPDTPKPPLWGDLVSEIQKHMPPSAQIASHMDPLRLAEEYRANFGQVALDGLIRTLICDDAWRPGKLHRDLLELPWSDVLTTNWDTLLDRAARAITNRTYEPVRTVADLVNARAPRVVKLHGSIGTTEHFIVAEEDYRTYPVRFAAFVNLARQVFIESELCLLGFSGDDPNFVQWSGWVRDHLNQSARRIYLVNVLNISPSTRKYLEARNIAPIDLAPLVEDIDDDEKHTTANRLFLDFLASAKPRPAHEWTPIDIDQQGLGVRTPEDQLRRTKDDAYAAPLLLEASKYWKQDRETYPDWLVCPPSERLKLRLQTDAVPFLRKPIFDKLGPNDGPKILYEIAWRYTVALWPIDSRLSELIAAVADPQVPTVLTKRQQLDLATILLRAAREAVDISAFSRWEAVLESHAEPGSDFRAESAYQRCLWARDELNFELVSVELRNITGVDPIWVLRRSALLYECGDLVAAESLITEALDDLRQRQRDDRQSLWVRSRRAWAEWLARAMQREKAWSGDAPRWPVEFEAARCDPWHEIQGIREAAAKDVREARKARVQQFIPRFEPGHYSDPSNVVRFQSSTVVEPAYELDRLSEITGVPLRMPYTRLLSDIARDVAEVIFGKAESAYFRVLRVADQYDDPLIDQYFGRISVARLSSNLILPLSERLTRAIKFWRNRAKSESQDPRGRLFAISRLRTAVEMQARLTPRMAPSQARTMFDLAIDLAQEPAIRHPWMFEQLRHLVDYSIAAIPPTDRGDLVLSVLEWPLPDETPPGPEPWPNPVTALFESRMKRPDGNPLWASCIDQLVKAVESKGPRRIDATLRLAYLATERALTAVERNSFACALWAQTDDGSPPLPQNTNLYPHMFADLPTPSSINSRESVSDRLYGTAGFGKNNGLIGAIAAATSGRSEDTVLRPTPDQAVRIFDSLVGLRLAKTGVDQPIQEALSRPMREAGARHIGVALALAVAPSLSGDTRTEGRAEALLKLISELPCPVAVAALPVFANANEQLRETIVRCIRHAVIGRTFEEILGGTAAIDVWLQLEKCGEVVEIPQELIDRIIAAAETTRGVGWNLLVGCVRHLVEASKLCTEDGARLDEALGDLRLDAAYDNRRIDPEGEKAITLPLVRAESVRLAGALTERGLSGPNARLWLEDAKIDPLPEVRFALEERSLP